MFFTVIKMKNVRFPFNFHAGIGILYINSGVEDGTVIITEQIILSHFVDVHSTLEESDNAG